MATEPQSSSQAPVKTSLRISTQYMSVRGMCTYPKTWVVGREKKLASKQKLNQLYSNAHACKSPWSRPKYSRHNCCIALVLTLPKLYLA